MMSCLSSCHFFYSLSSIYPCSINSLTNSFCLSFAICKTGCKRLSFDSEYHTVPEYFLHISFLNFKSECLLDSIQIHLMHICDIYICNLVAFLISRLTPLQVGTPLHSLMTVHACVCVCCQLTKLLKFSGGPPLVGPPGLCVCFLSVCLFVDI